MSDHIFEAFFQAVNQHWFTAWCVGLWVLMCCGALRGAR